MTTVNEAVTRYLQQFDRELRGLPEPDRLDAVREIQSHLEDGCREGESAEAVIARLGAPQALARAYLSAYHLNRTEPGTIPKFWPALSAMVYFASVGFGGMFVVPILAALTFALGLTGIVAPLAGVARMFGAHWVSMSGPGGPLPMAWSIPVGLLLGIVGAAGAWGSWLLLRLYFRLVARGYRQWAMLASLAMNPVVGK